MGKNKFLDRFMGQFPFEGITFDDVSLVTQYADFLPDQADISTRLTRNTTAKSPFLSAAMDTVTEYQMAIAMALKGGIGVIHKNLDPEEQARHVARVKHHSNGIIRDPIYVHETDTIQSILEKRARKGWKFHSFPVVGSDGKLAGILTETDFDFCDDLSLQSSQIMVRNPITADVGTTVQSAYDIMKKNKIRSLPIIDSSGKLNSLYVLRDVKSILNQSSSFHNVDSNNQLRVAAAVGPGKDLDERIERLLAEHVDIIVVDTAHGHSKGVIDTVLKLNTYKSRYTFDIIAGNVATEEGARALCEAGADAIKVGIGPGSICTTRIVSGVGIPQITAIYEAKKGAGDLPVIADGGIKYSGDVPKALVAGADSVMMGGVLAGTEESPGEKIIYQGRNYVSYRGMGSIAAMKERGARERYNQGDVKEDELVPQGIEGLVPNSGSVNKVLIQYCGGLRAGMGYTGCRTIPELQERGKFVRVSPAGIAEAHPHDVTITKEAPNYRTGSN